MKLNYMFQGQHCSDLPGIYVIHNATTGPNKPMGRVYIGQTYRFAKRWYQHIYALVHGGRKCNKFLLNDYNKCKTAAGHDEFMEFRVIEVMPNSTQIEREAREEVLRQQLIAEYGPKNVYSKSVTLRPSGEKAWQKLSETLRNNSYRRGHRLTDEQKAALSEAQRKGWANKPESRARVRAQQTERLNEAGAREKLRTTTKELWQTPEYRAKMRENYLTNSNFGMTGKAQSEATKRKIGDANRGRPSPRKGQPLSEEHRRRIGEGNRGKKRTRKQNAAENTPAI